MATNTSRFSLCSFGEPHCVYATRHAQSAKRASFRLFTFWPTRFGGPLSSLPSLFSRTFWCLFLWVLLPLSDRQFVRFAFCLKSMNFFALLSALPCSLFSYSSSIWFYECVRRCVSCEILAIRTFSRPIFKAVAIFCYFLAFVELNKVNL